MQLIAVFACCFALVVLAPVVVFLGTSIFRASCRLCGLPRPGVMASAGKMLVASLGVMVVTGILNLAVLALCDATGVPRWEGEFVTFCFLLLPIDLAISAGVHAGFMGIRFGKAVEVWFVGRLIQLSIVTVALLIGVGIYLAGAGNG